MKTRILTGLFILVCIYFLTDCKKAKDLLGGDASMSADINGSHWSSSSVMTYYSEAAEPVGTTMIGQSVPDGKEFILHWKGILAEGTVTLVQGSDDYWITWANGSKSYTSISGSMTVSSKASDGKAAGSFQFQGKEDGGLEVISVANGVFSDVVRR